jgi:hypothetical protein
VTALDVVGAPQVRTPAYSSVGFGNLVRSEWTKLRSLRSMWLCAGLAAATMLGLAIGLGIRWAHQSGTMQTFDATNVSLSGVYLAQVIVGTVGVMTISSEYATRMIRASFAAVPQRRSLLAAKGLVLAAAVLVLSEILAFASFLVGQALMSSKHIGVSLSDPGVLRAVVGAGLFLTLVALLGFGLGSVVRHTAGALSAFFGILFALDPITDLLPTAWRDDIIDYLPLNAGSQIFVIVNNKGALGPWAGLGVFAIYALVAVVLGALLVDTRDA